jgi:hypothetical protein
MQTHFAHAAGVVKNGKLNGKAILPTLKFTGAEKLRRHLDREFYDEMNGILSKAHLGGDFKILLRTTIKGGPHTKGLRIGSPKLQFRCVEITYQGGSNDGRVAMDIYAQRPMDAYEFQKLMLAGQKCYYEDDEEEPAVHDTVSPARAAAEAVFTKPEPEVAKVAENILPDLRPAAPEPQTPPTIRSTNGRFVDDLELVELFMQEVMAFIDKKGWVRKSACCAVLTGPFGRKGGGVGKTLSTLVHAGHLLKVDGLDHYIVSESWLRRLGKLPETSATISEVKAAVLTATVVKPVVKTSPTVKVSAAAVSTDALAEQLEAMARKLREKKLSGSRISEIDTEIAELDKKAEALVSRRKELIDEKEVLQRSGRRQTISEARELLSQFESIR